MRSLEELTRKELVDTLNKDWMTHDGMWFFQCVQKLGIEKANELNLAAIEGLAPVEVFRVKQLLGIENEPIKSFEQLKSVLQFIEALTIPDFMGSYIEYSEDQCIAIGMKPDACFAKKGMEKMGVIDQYRCGVLHRINCMFKALDLKFKKSRPIGKCFMHTEGSCRLEFQFDFSDQD